MQSTLLHCHRDTSCVAVGNIKAAIRTGSGGTLTITYVLSGALDRLRIPDERACATDELWQHTCFELFVGAANDAEYYEFNFSPSGAWAAYGFRDYRDGGPIHMDGLEPKITVRRGAESLQLSASLHLDCLAGIRRGVRLTLGLSAVVEEQSGALSYWALNHPAGKPDLHHPDNFALQIELPVVDGGAVEYTAKP
jgi:hypothetical protein